MKKRLFEIKTEEKSITSGISIIIISNKPGHQVQINDVTPNKKEKSTKNHNTYFINLLFITFKYFIYDMLMAVHGNIHWK